MKKIPKMPGPAGGLIDRSGMIKALTGATAGLLPKNTQVSAAAIEKLLDIVVRLADAAALRVAEQLFGQIAAKLADEKLVAVAGNLADAAALRLAERLAKSKVVDALGGRVADLIAERLAARFADERFVGAVAGKFAEAFGDPLDGAVAVLQVQPRQAKGKRKP